MNFKSYHVCIKIKKTFICQNKNILDIYNLGTVTCIICRPMSFVWLSTEYSRVEKNIRHFTPNLCYHVSTTTRRDITHQIFSLRNVEIAPKKREMGNISDLKHWVLSIFIQFFWKVGIEYKFLLFLKVTQKCRNGKLHDESIGFGDCHFRIW